MTGEQFHLQNLASPFAEVAAPLGGVAEREVRIKESRRVLPEAQPNMGAE
jgi:hypothetical protein